MIITSFLCSNRLNLFFFTVFQAGLILVHGQNSNCSMLYFFSSTSGCLPCSVCPDSVNQPYDGKVRDECYRKNPDVTRLGRIWCDDPNGPFPKCPPIETFLNPVCNNENKLQVGDVCTITCKNITNTTSCTKQFEWSDSSSFPTDDKCIDIITNPDYRQKTEIDSDHNYLIVGIIGGICLVLLLAGILIGVLKFKLHRRICDAVRCSNQKDSESNSDSDKNPTKKLLPTSDLEPKSGANNGRANEPKSGALGFTELPDDRCTMVSEEVRFVDKNKSMTGLESNMELIQNHVPSPKLSSCKLLKSTEDGGVEDKKLNISLHEHKSNLSLDGNNGSAFLTVSLPSVESDPGPGDSLIHEPALKSPLELKNGFHFEKMNGIHVSLQATHKIFDDEDMRLLSRDNKVFDAFLDHRETLAEFCILFDQKDRFDKITWHKFALDLLKWSPDKIKSFEYCKRPVLSDQVGDSLTYALLQELIQAGKGFCDIVQFLQGHSLTDVKSLHILKKFWLAWKDGKLNS